MVIGKGARLKIQAKIFQHTEETFWPGNTCKCSEPLAECTLRLPAVVLIDQPVEFSGAMIDFHDAWMVNPETSGLAWSARDNLCVRTLQATRGLP